MAQTTDLLRTDLLHLDITDDGIATVWIDQPGASVNTISLGTIEAFEEAIDLLESESDIRGAVFISGKEASFIAGADLNMLKAFDTPADVRALSRRAHKLVARLQALPKPTVAAINGPAMGGGLEMTLGCTYRIASTHDKTRLALPEVKLGLLPGGGGTQYLPRLVGIQQALQMMLTGKNIYPRKAKRIGLVNALIHPPGLHRASLEAVRGLIAGTRSPDSANLSLTERLLESTSLSRRIVYQQAAERTKKQTRGNYPAPPRIIECVQVGMEDGLSAGLSLEAQYFGELAFTPESRALVSLFFAKQKGDKNPLKDQARPIERIGVLGAGLMGAGIAEVSSKNSLDVVLKDQNMELAAGGKKHIWNATSKQVRKRIISEFERDQIIERVYPTDDYSAFHAVDLVIEAVPENLDLKRQILADTEAVVRDDCVFASNTSSIPIAEIAAEAQRPERVLGMHYFSPVSQMPLLEIIRGPETSEEALATAIEAGRMQSKTVIVVNDGPGFYTTRILAIYMNEALLLLEEGGDAEEIDAYMKDFGFPMGPYELFDLVGIEVAAKITEVLSQYLDEEAYAISHSAENLVKANMLGQKNGRGFYRYEEENGKHERQDFVSDVYRYFGGYERKTYTREEVQQRLSLAMVNEAVRCLEEGVLSSPVDGDLGAVFGLGFPPFRGGPFRYVDTEGAELIVSQLHRLQEQHGERFNPCRLLEKHIAEQTQFHDD